VARTHTEDGRPRALGIVPPGDLGPLNAITDVGVVEVGVTTLIEGDGPLVVGEGPVRAPASPRSFRAAATASEHRARRAGIRSTAMAR
jgi:L-aminopeptidase/D-esterase-like protein